MACTDSGIYLVNNELIIVPEMTFLFSPTMTYLSDRNMVQEATTRRGGSVKCQGGLGSENPWQRVDDMSYVPPTA